jgi:hypothetical protein
MKSKCRKRNKAALHSGMDEPYAVEEAVTR